MNEVTTETTETPAMPVPATREEPPARKTTMAALVKPTADKVAGTAKVTVEPSGETAESRAVLREADGALKDWLGSVAPGPGHEFKISRTHPTSFNGVNTVGHLDTVQEFFSEEDLKERYGGGTFVVRVMNPTGKGGGHLNGQQRTIKVAGDPKISGLGQAPTGQTITVTDKASEKASDRLAGILESELKHARDLASRPRDDGPSNAMIQMLQNTINGLQSALSEANRRADAARAEKPVEDPFKQKMIETLMSEEGTRVQGVRMMYESEIRQLKTSQADDEKRLRDAFERDKQMLHMSSEREISTVRQSSEIALSSVKMSFETQLAILKHENAKQDKQIDRLEVELKDLRSRKDKSLIEQIKDVKEMKEALGIGEEAEESNLDKFVGMVTNPATIEFAQGVFGKGGNQQQAQAAQQAQQAAAQPFVPKIVKDRHGKKFAVGPNGEMVPIRKKPLAVATGAVTEDGTPVEVEIPVIDPEVIARVVKMLEAAFTSGSDVKLMIQTYRAHIPDDVVEAIRELKVDGFLSKVAKLPASSPLKSQAGRNWMRQVGDELLGEVTPDS